MKPIFEANHRWAMARGLESLEIELAQRRATTRKARSAIPNPPGPSQCSGLVLGAAGLIAALALGALAFGLSRFIKRSNPY